MFFYVRGEEEGEEEEEEREIKRRQEIRRKTNVGERLVLLSVFCGETMEDAVKCEQHETPNFTYFLFIFLLLSYKNTGASAKIVPGN